MISSIQAANVIRDPPKIQSLSAVTVGRESGQISSPVERSR